MGKEYTLFGKDMGTRKVEPVAEGFIYEDLTTPESIRDVMKVAATEVDDELWYATVTAGKALDGGWLVDAPWGPTLYTAKPLVTDVIFRWDQDEAVAVFPGINEGNGMVASYVHNGQHGACRKSWYNTTRPATEAEYASLKRELEAVPYEYTLRVVKRWNRK